MTQRFYLNDHDLTQTELRQFKNALTAFGATLSARESKYPSGDRSRLIAPTWAADGNHIEVASSQHRAADVEIVCRHFGFEVSKELLPSEPPSLVSFR